MLSQIEEVIVSSFFELRIIGLPFLINVVFFLIGLIYLFRNWRCMKKYNFSFIIGLVITLPLFLKAFLILMKNIWLGIAVALISLVIFVVLITYINIGIFFCNKLKIQAIPLITIKKNPDFFNFKYFGLILGIIFLMAIYSLFLSQFLTLTPFGQKIVEILRKAVGTDPLATPLKIFFLLTFICVTEELYYRLFLQNMIGYFLKDIKYGYFVAILITSILWALRHGGLWTPEWIKFMQVFILGIVLGFLMKRQGVESCVIIHFALNIFTPILCP